MQSPAGRNERGRIEDGISGPTCRQGVKSDPTELPIIQGHKV